jgi:hypothetical protein
MCIRLRGRWSSATLPVGGRPTLRLGPCSLARGLPRGQHGPIPPELVVRHRCDEPLCTATKDLALGTYADNRWDAIARPHRAADLDVRGSAGRSRAIREAVLRVLASDDVYSAVIGAAARAAMLAGDPNRDQLTLWPVPDGYLTAPLPAPHVGQDVALARWQKAVSALQRHPRSTPGNRAQGPTVFRPE